MDKAMVTRSFEGVWERMSRNERGILLPPPILEAINLRNVKKQRKRALVLFDGSKLRHDLTHGLITYLRVCDASGFRKTYDHIEGYHVLIDRMRFVIPNSLKSVLPLENRVGIVGSKDYFDIMDPIDTEEYMDLIDEEDEPDNFYGYL